jgi:hypothetical protein
MCSMTLECRPVRLAIHPLCICHNTSAATTIRNNHVHCLLLRGHLTAVSLVLGNATTDAVNSHSAVFRATCTVFSLHRPSGMEAASTNLRLIHCVHVICIVKRRLSSGML